MPRSSTNYKPVRESEKDVALKLLIDKYYMIDPCVGTRRLKTILQRENNLLVNRKRLQRLRREMGIEAIYCKPRRSRTNKEHGKYPYLLRGLKIEKPNQVWCTDITYIPMPHGSAYLCAVMDWYSRKVLGWAISNSMETSLCLEALEKALNNTGKVPEIFNTDQGSQFTSSDWTGKLLNHKIKISMDGKGRWMDNVFIERLWRSVKYEEVYLFEYSNIGWLREGLGKWFKRYNTWRPHASLGNNTPSKVYEAKGNEAIEMRKSNCTKKVG